MFHDPVEERFLETNVAPGLLALDPLVLQNLFPLGEEFLVENGVLYELRLLFSFGHLWSVTHGGEARSTHSALKAVDLASDVPIQLRASSGVFNRELFGALARCAWTPRRPL